MNSISDTFNYKNICQKAVEDDEVFSTFKQNPHYREILEHVSFEDGKKYLSFIKKYDSEIFNKIKTDFIDNDKLGSPLVNEFPDVGNVSPTTLRYVKTLVDFTRIFGNFENKKIIEIGSGYGGLCLILNKMFKNIDYTIIDLDEPAALAKKYLSKHNVNVKVLPINEVNNHKEEYDLVISNYAYSEVGKKLQIEYYNNIIKRCKHGYFILNFISNLFNIKSLTKDEIVNLFDKKINFTEEYPKTHADNIVMYF